MSETTNSRGWICAVVAVAFVTLGISGVLMLFHLNIPLDMKLLHIVMGVVFVVAGVIHLAANWKTLTTHLRKRPAIFASATAVAIAVALLFIGWGTGPEPRRYGWGQEELGIGPGGDFGNGSGPFGNGPRGNGPGGPFGNGRWGGPGNEGPGDIE